MLPVFFKKGPRYQLQYMRPLLIYDGNCGFCKFWIERWRHLTGTHVDYSPYQEVADQFPQISKEQFQKSVQLIRTDGTVLSGANAVFETLATNSSYAWLPSLYQKIPPFRFLSEWFYELVARNRTFFSKVTKFFWGTSTESSTYFIPRRIFLAWLGVTYLLAFASLGVQVTGLFGARGILPIASLLNLAKSILGSRCYGFFPTIFWLSSSDFFMKCVCWAGAFLSFGLIFGIASFPIAILLWFFYLSFVTVGQDFLSFQWDVLLLETGFLAIFIAPLNLKLKSRPLPPLFIFVLLMRWLLFRLMFSSGMVKLASGDPTWQNWTALTYHYETQPLPTWIGWYFHHLPVLFHKLSAAIMFLVELFVPFLIFLPRRPRLFAAVAIVGFQILIGLTGNYCFFNFLTVGLCLWLIDDQTWPSKFRSWISTDHISSSNVIFSFFRKIVLSFAALIIFLLSVDKVGQLQPFHLVNHYGLFAIMTTERPEIIVEGSEDGHTWLPYGFRYKPDDPKKKPVFVEPHQPRLDWQMWFAALSDYRFNRWFLKFCQRLLEGSPEVLRLLRYNPFPNHPPKYIRAMVYQYHFSSFSLKRREQVWWVREKKGLYCPVLSLKPSNSS